MNRRKFIGLLAGGSTSGFWASPLGALLSRLAPKPKPSFNFYDLQTCATPLYRGIRVTEAVYGESIPFVIGYWCRFTSYGVLVFLLAFSGAFSSWSLFAASTLDCERNSLFMDATLAAVPASPKTPPSTMRVATISNQNLHAGAEMELRNAEIQLSKEEESAGQLEGRLGKYWITVSVTLFSLAGGLIVALGLNQVYKILIKRLNRD